MANEYPKLEDKFNLMIAVNDTGLQDIYMNHNHFNPGDAGIDLYTPEDVVIPPHAIGYAINHKISTHVSRNGKLVGYYLYPRSSISNTPLRLANSVGIIDKGYTGNIIAKVDNLSDQAYSISKGARLFQICNTELQSFTRIIVMDKLSTDEAPNSIGRGTSGFGSTGQ